MDLFGSSKPTPIHQTQWWPALHQPWVSHDTGQPEVQTSLHCDTREDDVPAGAQTRSLPLQASEDRDPNYIFIH